MEMRSKIKDLVVRVASLDNCRNRPRRLRNARFRGFEAEGVKVRGITSTVHFNKLVTKVFAFGLFDRLVSLLAFATCVGACRVYKLIRLAGKRKSLTETAGSKSYFLA